jgi:ketosteroid isomerase-like protein
MTPEEIDHVIQKARVFSNPGRNLDNWKLISGIYSEDSQTIDPFGKHFSGLDGIKEAWADWAPRKRYTHGWSEHVVMLTEDVAIKFYRYPNCGEDDDGEPWDFMCDGFYILQKQEEGNWIVLLDCPFCKTREWIGKPEMTNPWDALLEPVSGDKRVTEGDYVNPMEAGRRDPGPPEECGLCQSLEARKHGDRNGSAAKVTCRPGYVVPTRPRLVPSPVFHEDDLCWVAECELCSTPMVISKKHNEVPSDEEVEAMESRLREVVDEHYGYEPWIDPANLRIPDHYHAHARPLGRLMAHALNRPAVPVD